MKTSQNPWATAALAGVLVLLAALAVSQHRWLDQIAQAQRVHLKEESQRRSRALAHAVDRAVTSLFIGARFDAAAVRRNDGASFGEALAKFRAETAHPGLLKAVYVWTPSTTPKALRAFDEKTRTFTDAAWPDALAPVRRRLDPPSDGTSVRVSMGAGLVAGDSAGAGDEPALLAPLTETIETRGDFRTPRLGSDAGPGVFFSHRAVDMRGVVIRSDALGVAILALDRDYLLERVAKPALVEVASEEFEAALARSGDGSVVLSSRGDAKPPSTPDASTPSLRLAFDDIDASLLRRVAPELDSLVTKNAVRMVFQVNDRMISTETRTTGPGTGVAAGPVKPGTAHAVWTSTGARPGAWNAVVWHRAGSVETAVEGQRHRNLALSLGALGLLGASSALIYASARRARALASRQVDFVASVSHELRTPVAVIRSAADNLADGVVQEPEKTKRYGEVIRAEANRLSDLVDQVLTFAGADRADVSKLEPFEAAIALRSAAGELAAFAASRNATLEVRDFTEGARVRGDAKQLARALRNLIENGLKYGGEAPKVEALAKLDGGSVAFEVSDSGPAWNPDEADRLFEPFFRGRAALESTVAGSGLGLALVQRIAESHRGTIAATRREGGGALFTLKVPRA